MTMENSRYVVRNDDGVRMGSARTKRQAQDLIDTLSMLADQSSRVIGGAK